MQVTTVNPALNKDWFTMGFARFQPARYLGRSAS
jgi:hypothetical protein